MHMESYGRAVVVGSIPTTTDTIMHTNFVDTGVEPQVQSSPDSLDSHTNTQTVRPSYVTAAKRAL